MADVRETAIERSASWWYCDNIVNHPGQVGLLRMDFPRVFILIRDFVVASWASFEAWKQDIVELNFMDPEDREDADIESILIDAWNFLGPVEEREEELAEEREAEEDY